jgi:peptidoglycan hydrolase-like protein with peptidoglycan-binding domain
VATPKDAMPASASLSHPRTERSPRRRLRQRVNAAMPTKKSRLLSIAMAGGLVLAGVTTATITNTGHTPTTNDSLAAANVASSSAVNLDDCPTLTEGYPPGGCVIQLQTELNTDNGTTTTPVDGVFGPQTKAAVITFQQNNHIVPADGIVGPQTKAALDNPGSSSAGTPPGQLNPGQQITSGTQVASPDGKFVLQMQSDGNLVLRAPGNTPLGDTHTAGHDGTIAMMQADGNFVLTAPGNIPVWASGTDGHPGTVLQVQDDGNVVLYAPGHQVLRVLFPAVPNPTPTVPSATITAPGTSTATPAPGTSGPNPAPAPEHCGTAEDTMNIMDPTLLGVPGPGAGSVHLQMDWCWDGSKITRLGNPVVWTTKTGNGGLLEWNTNTPIPNDEDPQNGGYWTRETVVTGTYQFCAVSYCLPTQPFKLDLYIFGDGVKYIANRVNVKASPL